MIERVKIEPIIRLLRLMIAELTCEIVKFLHKSGMTFNRIGELIGVTRQRIQQIYCQKSRINIIRDYDLNKFNEHNKQSTSEAGDAV